MKTLVQALERPNFSSGTFKTAWRAGRCWPTGNPVEVEVIDAVDDPPADTSGVIRIGRATLAVLAADPHLVVREAGKAFGPDQVDKAARLRSTEAAEAAANEQRRARVNECERLELIEEMARNPRFGGASWWV